MEQISILQVWLRSRSKWVMLAPAPAPINCPQHIQFPLEIFCESCDEATCKLCIVQSHQDHKVLSMEYKNAEIKKRLKDKLKTSKRDVDEMTKRQEELSNAQEELEACTQKAIKEMRHQLNEVTANLASMFSKEVSRVKETKRKQVLQFGSESAFLQKMIKRMEKLQDRIGVILENSMTGFSVEQAKDLLRDDFTERYVSAPADGNKWWQKRIYEAPDFEFSNFLDYAEKHLIGHFNIESSAGQEDRIAGSTISKDHSRSASKSSTNSRSSFNSKPEKLSKDTPIAISIESSSDLSSNLHEDQEAERMKSESCSRSASTNAPPETEKEKYVSSDTDVGSSTDRFKYGFQLESRLSVRALDSPAIKTIFDVLFANNSIWACGWHSNRFAKHYVVLFNWNGSGTSVTAHKKRGDPLAEVPAVMTSFGSNVLFAKNYGNQIMNFDTDHLNFSVKYTNMAMALGSMTCSQNYLYYIDRVTGQIGVLDSSFREVQTVSTGIKKEEVASSDLDLCLLPIGGSLQESTRKVRLSKNNIVVSKSAPNGFVRAIDIMGEVLWHIEETSSMTSVLPFDPNSVSASENGTIFVADRSRNKVSRFITSFH